MLKHELNLTATIRNTFTFPARYIIIIIYSYLYVIVQ